jgi:beta-N-acetylhexosaminidase
VPPEGARLLITGFRGTSASDPEVVQVLRYLAAGSIAGVLLLRRNIVSPEQLLQLTHAMRQAANPEVPIIAIDQEGGMVARLDATNGFSPWPSASEVASQDLS